MNLRKQVEPLLSAALQASSKQRRAQRATSRLAWDLRWLRRASENHHEQSRSLTILSCDPGRVKTCAFTLLLARVGSFIAGPCGNRLVAIGQAWPMSPNTSEMIG